MNIVVSYVSPNGIIISEEIASVNPACPSEYIYCKFYNIIKIISV